MNQMSKEELKTFIEKIPSGPVSKFLEAVSKFLEAVSKSENKTAATAPAVAGDTKIKIHFKREENDNCFTKYLQENFKITRQ
jgi:hypothetical protein